MRSPSMKRIIIKSAPSGYGECRAHAVARSKGSATGPYPMPRAAGGTTEVLRLRRGLKVVPSIVTKEGIAHEQGARTVGRHLRTLAGPRPAAPVYPGGADSHVPGRL